MSNSSQSGPSARPDMGTDKIRLGMNINSSNVPTTFEQIEAKWKAEAFETADSLDAAADRTLQSARCTTVKELDARWMAEAIRNDPSLAVPSLAGFAPVVESNPPSPATSRSSPNSQVFDPTTLPRQVSNAQAPMRSAPSTLVSPWDPAFHGLESSSDEDGPFGTPPSPVLFTPETWAGFVPGSPTPSSPLYDPSGSPPLTPGWIPGSPTPSSPVYDPCGSPPPAAPAAPASSPGASELFLGSPTTPYRSTTVHYPFFLTPLSPVTECYSPPTSPPSTTVNPSNSTNIAPEPVYDALKYNGCPRKHVLVPTEKRLDGTCVLVKVVADHCPLCCDEEDMPNCPSCGIPMDEHHGDMSCWLAEADVYDENSYLGTWIWGSGFDTEMSDQDEDE